MKKVLVAVVVGVLFLGTGCSSLATKSWATAGSCDAFKIVTTDPASGTPLPTLIAGGGVHCMVFSKPYKTKENVPTIITYSRRESMWGLFSGGVGAGNVSFIYVAGSKETPIDTIAILNAAAKVVNDERIKQIKK